MFVIKIKQVIRKLRKEQTYAEGILWEEFRGKKLGKKFIRQYPVLLDNRLFVLDFYCSKAKLGIELDGAIHDNLKDYDDLRENMISLKNINIIRFSNDEIETNLESVIEKVKKEIDL